MFSVNQVSVSFSGVPLFEGISFIINARDRIGLVGKNGAGKTTLLRLVHGEQDPDKGNVVIPQGKETGYLPQEMIIVSDKTVLEEAMTAFQKVIRLQTEIDQLVRKIEERNDVESPDYLKIIDRLQHAHEEYDLFGGPTMQADTEKVLTGLGFEPGDFSRRVTEFSGGWQMRIELAKILLRKPALILLDEPTNHLDIESIQWLEEFLQNYPGAIVLVSHDRAFLDNVTERTIEISLGKVYDYKACYSDYVLLREERREHQIAAHSNQQRQIEQIERFITRFRYKATKSRQVQSKLKYLNKLDRVEIDEVDTSTIHFRFPAAPHSGKIVLEAEGLSKYFGDRMVLRNIGFALKRGEKVAFVGRNGEGKTTLSRIIVGDLDHTGKLDLGHQVKIGYFAQNQAELLNMDLTVFQTIDHAATGEMRTRTRALLGSFLFSAEALDKKVKVLSGGEKTRLAIAKLLLTPVNLLVLDEPTNHLDMVSKDILKNALLKYDGTLIIVSHDRDFLQGLTNKVFEFKNHTIRQYNGDIYDFLDSRKLASLKQLEQQKKNRESDSQREIGNSRKGDYERKREWERDLRKIQTRINKLEEEITQTESGIKHDDEVLTDPSAFPELKIDEGFYAAYQGKKELLVKLMAQWEKLQQELGQFNTGF